MLQVDVAELVGRAYLAKHASVFVGVGEEGHDVAGEAVAGGEVVAGEGEGAGGGAIEGGGEAENEARKEADGKAEGRAFPEVLAERYVVVGADAGLCIGQEDPEADSEGASTRDAGAGKEA